VDAAGLNAPFPLARIAAAVKTGDDQKAVRLGEEKQRVGRSLGARPPQCFVDHGKLPGLSAMRWTTLSISARKRRPKPRRLGLVPILRVAKFSARGFDETNQPH
jgi:hypothetical protein